MAFFKWFGQVAALREMDQGIPPSPLPPFDFAVLKPVGFLARWGQSVISFAFQRGVPPILRLCQTIWPVAFIRFLNLVIVTRDEDVRTILGDSENFGVPYGPEMQDLGAGTTFALGLDGEGHARQRSIMADVLRANDREIFAADMQRVLEQTAACAKALIDNGGGRIDVMRDYVTRITTETAQGYFGLDITDADAFAEWTMATSCMLFGDPGGDRKTRDLALNASARLRLSLGNSIARAQRNWEQHPDTEGRETTILDRLIKLQRERQETDNPIRDSEISAILFGLITGFIPTNTLAAGKILSELLRRPAIWADACRHAVAGQREALKAILKEAARLDPALAPGQWRVARQDCWIAANSRRARRVRRETIVLLATATALRDPRRFDQPNRFRTDRTVDGDLMFGWGPHACMGSQMAIEQITTMFQALLALPGLVPVPGREGRMEYTGVFPVRLGMQYDHPGACQSMFLVVVPVPPELATTKAEIDACIAGLGNPASDIMRRQLDSTDIVHFASLATVDSENGVHIIFELSVDGPAEEALRSIAATSTAQLRPVFDFAGLGKDDDLADFLIRHIVQLRSRPWGATGLDYNGTSEFPVAMTARQRDLAAHVEAILADYLGREIGDGNHPMLALAYVRRILKGDRYHLLMTKSRRAVLSRQSLAQRFDTLILKPSRARLKLADYTTPSYLAAAWAFLKSQSGLVLTLPLLAVWLPLFIGLWAIVNPPAPLWCRVGPVWNWEPWYAFDCSFAGHLVAPWGWSILAIGLAPIAATLLIFALALLFAWRWLRCKEKRDVVDSGLPSLDKLAAIVASEDAPGHAQNHIMAVGTLKPGLFRTLAHALALWGIKMIIIFYYRPGFVINMGTIHYARWWRLPGTRRAIFYSNYDGSWESYLEDFITRARWGQSAAWSNWQGFPRTRSLIFAGAEDSDGFKHWVRKQQQVAPFWYNRFPDLTTDQIRNNALIHHGLARADNHSEAREWLRCFGSMPRVANLVETHEVQSLVLRGFPSLPHSACLAIQLPPLGERRLGRWLDWAMGGDCFVDPPRSAIVDAAPMVFDRKGRRATLRQSYCITFGDRQSMGEDNPSAAVPNKGPDTGRERHGNGPPGAAFLACSAAGFDRICSQVPPGLGDDLKSGFSSAFQMGMGRRARVLGDIGAAAPEAWSWADVPTPQAPAVEAVLFLYADDGPALAAAKAAHIALLDSYGGRLLYERDCGPVGERRDFDHFGFRDGISQPVIRGTERFSRGAPARDIVEPGEFLIGYANNQGFCPPTPLVRAEADPTGNLPVSSGADLSRYPDFGASPHDGGPRDFGRNGSYLVIREMQQHVDKFESFAVNKAHELLDAGVADDGQPGYPDLFKIAGQMPTPDWIKAKMIGRWPDGRPLVGNPVQQGPMKPRPHSDEQHAQTVGEDTTREIAHYRDQRFNDFSYGTDDPQGFACPFGAHIRRANPRDSKEPGDATEQYITNRHRLLRRGRSYDGSATNPDDRGMLFVALCADLERQYEFVQQTWVNSPGFHGLAGEPDPLTAPDTGAARKFTIPTPAGPVRLAGLEQFVTVRAGGYFFLPSRSALAFLKETAFRYGG